MKGAMVRLDRCEKIQVANTKDALVRIEHDAVGSELFKDNSQVFEVLFRCGAGNEDIISVGVR